MSNLEKDPSSWREVLTGEFAPVSAMLAAGIALHAININISATMLPSIVAEIGGQKLYAWNATVFTLTAILTASLTGKLLRRTGAGIAFGLAGAVFAIGSAITALSPTMMVMLVGRAIQGAGGGMVFTLCYAMIIFVYPERLWPRAMALLSGTWGIATLFGPAVGGMFAEFGVWRAGFASLLPVTAVFVVFALRVLPKVKAKAERPEPIPFVQLALLAGSVLAVSTASLAVGPVRASLGVVLSVLLFWFLARRENSSEVRLFPRGTMVWGSPLSMAFATMSLLILCVNAEFFMPYYLQRLYGLGPLIAGYIAALVSIGWACSEVPSARLTGGKMHRAVRAGPIVMVVCTGVLALATPVPAELQSMVLPVICVALICAGMGIGLGWPHLNTFALQLTDASERENAAAALSVVQMFAVAFGTALAGLVTNMTGFAGEAGRAGIANSAVWLFMTFAAVAAAAVWTSRTLIASQANAGETAQSDFGSSGRGASSQSDDSIR